MNIEIATILEKAQTAPAGHAQLVEKDSEDEMSATFPVQGEFWVKKWLLCDIWLQVTGLLTPEKRKNSNLIVVVVSIVAGALIGILIMALSLHYFKKEQDTIQG